MYGLTIALGIIICIFLTEKLCKNKGLDTSILWELSFWLILVGVVGARVYHVVDMWEAYSQNLIAALYVWNGGVSIFGALLAGIPTAALYLRSKKQNVLEWLDIFSVVAPLGQAIGRWGNVFNNELMPFALYESAADLVLFGLLYLIYRQKPRSGIVLAVYLIGYLLIRILLQPFRL
jgi:prolipoprotein diacylglyceryl transferase